MVTSRALVAVAVAATVLSGCRASEPSVPPTEPAMPGDIDREPDAVGTLSSTWIAGGGGPVEVTPERASWGLAANNESWDGAALSIKRTPAAGVSNGEATVFFDGDGNEIPDPSEGLWEGQQVRVWCDIVATSLPPICSVSHLQLPQSREG